MFSKKQKIRNSIREIYRRHTLAALASPVSRFRAPRVGATHHPVEMSTGKHATLTLYRHVLKAATRFPSKNRVGIVQDIKTEFREARGETDGETLKKKLTLARDGLDRLRAFSGLDQGSTKWEVSLKGPYDGA